MMRRLASALGTAYARAPGRTVVLGAFLLLLAANPACLGYPPYWDGLIAVFHQAAWLHHHHFDFQGLLQDVPGFTEGGPRVYTTSIVPPLLALLARAVPSPPAYYAVCHLLTLAAAAGIAGVFHRLLRERVAEGLVWPLTLLLGVNPFFMAQAWSLNLELLLMLPSVLAWHAFSRGRNRAALGWLLLAWAVKTTALMHGIALAAGMLLGPRPFARRLGWAALFLLPCALFVAASAWENAVALQPVLGEKWILPERLGQLAVWTHAGLLAYSRVPDLATLGAWTAVAGLVSLAARRLPAGGEPGRPSDAALILAAVTAFAAWFGLNMMLVIPLPRYLFATLPFALTAAGLLLGRGGAALPRATLAAWGALGLAACLLMPEAWHLLAGMVLAGGVLSLARTPQFARAALWGAVALSLAGHNGALARATAILDDSNQGSILERSREFTGDLAFLRGVARAMEERYSDKVIATSWPFLHAFVDPFFGYVTRPLKVAASHRPGMPAWGVKTLPDHIASTPGARPEDYVLVWADYVFALPHPGLTDDLILERIRIGDREALVYRLPGAPAPGN